MENNEMKIRDIFYKDLSIDYRDNADKSLLYQYFWTKGMEELLEKIKKELPKKHMEDLPEIKPENERKIKGWLTGVMENNTEWARGQMLKKAPAQNGSRERRDFWEELCLGDAGYQAGLITDTEYYVWLVEYLKARSVYYKDFGVGKIRDAHTWLYKLLQAGLRDTEYALASDELRKKNIYGGIENVRTKAQVEGDLGRLAKLLQSERDEGEAETSRGESGPGIGKAARRLCGLKLTAKNKAGNVEELDYLPWLTSHLKKMAIHIKIKTWLQDSGYPFKAGGEIQRETGRSRKQDFTMQLFETYIDRNYDLGSGFIRKDEGGSAALGMWHWEGAFSVADRNLAKALFERVRQNGKENIYIPLAIHAYTGCVFFLAGKENYRKLYEDGLKENDKDNPEERKEKRNLKNAYQNAKECCCFDYLRLVSGCEDKYHGDFGGAYQMQRSFHENIRKDYDTVLNEFKRYCQVVEGGPLQAIKFWNEEMPPGIPDEFLWAFDGQEEFMEKLVSREAAKEFRRMRKNK